VKRIEPFEGVAKELAEIYQKVEMQFAFALPTSDPDKFKQVHQFVLCRDFLHDAVRAHLTKVPYKIYGFVFDPSKDELYTKRMLMLVRLPNIERKIEVIEHLLHLFEKKMKIKRSIVHKTDLKNTLLLEGSRVWMSSSQMVSLYTFLPRIACHTNEEIVNSIMESKTLKPLLAFWKQVFDTDGSDTKHLPPLGKYLNTILSNRNKIGLTPENTLTVKIVSVSNFHNYSGIVSLCKEETMSIPHIRTIHKKLREIHNKKSGVNRAVK